jgi:hypothetical protein
MAASAGAATYTVFDPPGSVERFPREIDASGVVFGSWGGDGVHGHGFVRDTDGAISTFPPPKIPTSA